MFAHSLGKKAECIGISWLWRPSKNFGQDNFICDQCVGSQSKPFVMPDLLYAVHTETMQRCLMRQMSTKIQFIGLRLLLNKRLPCSCLCWRAS